MTHYVLRGTLVYMSIARVKKITEPIFKRHDVKRAAVFGSVARGRAESSSDIDLLVEFNGKKSLLDLVSLELELTKRLGKKANVVTYRSIHPLLRRRILKERRTIYGKRS